MALAHLSSTAIKDAQLQFESSLPQIRRTLIFFFRNWPRRLRAEAIADALAACWHAWVGLVQRGQDPIAVGLTGIAFNGYRAVKGGRQLGCGTCGRSHVDILDRRAQFRLGLHVVSFDSPCRSDPDMVSQAWRDCLSENRRSGPAEIAASRIDFADWLGRLPARKREMAQMLALGEETGSAARTLGVTPSAVSQARAWLYQNWRLFQAQAGASVPGL